MNIGELRNPRSDKSEKPKDRVRNRVVLEYIKLRWGGNTSVRENATRGSTDYIYTLLYSQLDDMFIAICKALVWSVTCLLFGKRVTVDWIWVAPRLYSAGTRQVG